MKPASFDPSRPGQSEDPAFGQADLSNCEREQIHLAGSIQPHGTLLVIDASTRRIVRAAANARGFLALGDDPLGQRLDTVMPDAWDCLTPHLGEPLDRTPLSLRCHSGTPLVAYDCHLHRLTNGDLVLEFERAEDSVDLSGQVETCLQAFLSAASLRTLCDEAARRIKAIAGYDRVMVYRFDDDGHGEVFSEAREDRLEAFLGNRYPRSDIPQMARRLYERNRIRLLVDVNYKAVPVESTEAARMAGEFDMSLCALRSMSPIHIQYLKNMGVSATLVLSLVVGERLWGLVACHHYSPRLVQYEHRVVCELLAETVATRIAALEGFARTQAEIAVRRLEQRMIDAIQREGQWQSALFDASHTLLQPVRATGAALLVDDQVLVAGDVPGTLEVREIGAWLDAQPRIEMFATASLGKDNPAFAPLVAVASGVLAVPVSKAQGEYLLWFRPERVRTLTWGGDPFKPVEIGSDPADLSPRRSFSQWHQLVEGTSDPWTEADRTAGRLIGGTVSDVVLQFRSVRLLIAQEQLRQVSRRVTTSEQAVIVSDAGGRVILANDAFARIEPDLPGPLQWLNDLPDCCTDPGAVRAALEELVHHRRPWRGELDVRTETGALRPLLVRGDPVFSSPDHVLGFVVLFNDLSQRREAEAARRRFQESLVDQRRMSSVRLDSKTDLVYRNILSSAIGNAQLAALEITDSVDTTRMPELLDSIGASLARTDRLLQLLLWHANGGRNR